MASVTLQNLTKSYGAGAIAAVKDLNLEIEDGKFLVLVGPSGCGKSTALRMIAGLEDITDGAVWIGDEFVNDVHPKERDIAMVFQNYALYPHMTVFDNIAFALQIARLPKAEIKRRVHETARILELEAFLKRRPGQLSGGQRQRVAMGRAIVRQPAVFLMDEPLSNLDAKLRVQMRAEIARLQHRLGVTTIYVTHDQVEAMTMGDRVALLKDGVLQQVDAPTEIYNRPRNTFVAAFIGSPTMNLYRADLHLHERAPVLRLGSNMVALGHEVAALFPELADHAGKRVVAGIRPEDVFQAEAPANAAGRQTLGGRVELVEALGSDVMVHIGVDAEPADIRGSDGIDALGEEGAAGRCVARFSAKSHVAVGDHVKVGFDLERLHLFDGGTGETLRG